VTTQRFRRRRAGAVTVHLSPSTWATRSDAFPGTKVKLVVDARVAGADLYGGVNVVQPGMTIPLHWHRRGELQFVLAGRGVLLHPNGRETPVGPRSAVFSPAGRAGGHGFRATGSRPLEILFFYASRGGKRPWTARYERG
jgi:oxalate decarboxylase/phosphoglucose isomerase-like protein (cupin superfamily)